LYRYPYQILRHHDVRLTKAAAAEGSGAETCYVTLPQGSARSRVNLRSASRVFWGRGPAKSGAPDLYIARQSCGCRAGRLGESGAPDSWPV